MPQSPLPTYEKNKIKNLFLLKKKRKKKQFAIKYLISMHTETVFF